jgi:hypothetical protein
MHKKRKTTNSTKTSTSTNEIIENCIRYEGNLHPNVNNVLMKFSFPLIQNLIQEKIVTKSRYEYIFLNSKFVKNNQILVHSFEGEKNNDNEEEEEENIIFILFVPKAVCTAKNIIVLNEESLRASIRFDGLYLMPKNVFKSLKIIRNIFKPLDLRKTVKIDDFQSNKMVIAFDDDNHVHNTVAIPQEIVSNTPKTVQINHYTPFSLWNYIKMLNDSFYVQESLFANHTEYDYLAYIGVIGDCILLNNMAPMMNNNDNYLSNDVNNKLKRKFIERYNYATINQKCNIESRNQLFMEFTSQMIQHLLNCHKTSSYIQKSEKQMMYSKDMNVIPFTSLHYDFLPLTKEIVQTELFLFKNTEKDIDTFHEIIVKHVNQYKSDVENFSFLPSWFNYQFQDEGEKGVFWKKLSQNEYKIRYEWLLKVDKNEWPERVQMIKGFVNVDETLLTTIFFPIIYEAILQDIILYIIYMNIYQKCHYEKYCKITMRNAHFFYELIALPLDKYNLLSSTTLSTKDLCTFLSEYGDNSSSPIIRKWVKLHPEREDQSNKLNSYIESHLLLKSPKQHKSLLLPDIEDIISPQKKQEEEEEEGIDNKKKKKRRSNDLLPPCLRSLMDLSYLKHYDRWNIIKYYYVMGFSEEDVITILKGKTEKISDITDAYRNCKKRDGPEGLSIMPCSWIMNYIPPDNNFFHCPYEKSNTLQLKPFGKNDRVHGDGNKYPMDDKYKIISTCLCSNFEFSQTDLQAPQNDKFFMRNMSPVDFVMLKMNQ